jgi:glycosyltransferase involved in cell wall biosynthesis
MNNPLISIGLPTYNRPKSLARALNSLVNQSYNNLEIIIADNGSTEMGVEDIISRFLVDKRIKYFRHSVNKGAIFNFNFVLGKFNGEYFLRLGDDDWLDSNYVESCLSFLLENPEYVCAYGRTKLFDLNGEFIKSDSELSMEQQTYFERVLHHYRFVSQNGPYFGLTRKEALKCVVGKKKYAEDWLGVARLCFTGRIKMLTNTSLNLSLGGVGGSAEGIVQSFGLSKFNLYFPHLSIAINAFNDILWHSDVYRKISFRKRLSLAIASGKEIYRRFGVKMEIVGSYKIYLKSILTSRR